MPTSHRMVTAVGKGIDRAHGKSEVRPKVRKPLSSSHCMVTAVRKGIDRAHGKSEVRPKVRKPLSWDLLTKGRRCGVEVETERWIF